MNNALEQRRIRLSSSPPVSAEQLAQEASSHIWVEYRLEGKWVALDPASRRREQAPPSPREVRRIRRFPRQTPSGNDPRRGRRARPGWALLGARCFAHQRPAADLHGAAVALRFEVQPAGVGWSAAPVLHVDTESIKGNMIAGSGMGAGSRGLAERVSGGLSGRASQAPSEVVALWLEADS